MFYKYPAAATAENWLHEFLVTTIKSMHLNATPGKRLLKWPDCIPTRHRNTLKGYTSLKDGLKSYEKALRKIDKPAQDRVLKCVEEQNRIEELLAATLSCDKLNDLPKAIQLPIKNLFNCAFGLLTPLGIRDRQYELIYEAAQEKVCPFCYCEDFDAPNRPRYELDENGKQIREALDHYLPRDAYPFAASNLRNLAPMGGRCNHYKHDTDIINRLDGTRRRVFFPYSGNGIQITLNKSKPFTGNDKVTPNWQIEFVPSSEETKTWDEVFFLSKRLRRNVLNQSYQRWLKQFCYWYVEKHKKRNPTNVEITSALEDHYSDLVLLRALKGREYFRGLVIQMLRHQCSRGDSRLLRYIKNAIQVAVPP